VFGTLKRRRSGPPDDKVSSPTAVQPHRDHCAVRAGPLTGERVNVPRVYRLIPILQREILIQLVRKVTPPRKDTQVDGLAVEAHGDAAPAHIRMLNFRAGSYDVFVLHE
jgi:hypothetical protein